MKSHKMPYIVHADIESLIKKIDGCTNNPEKFLTTKLGENIRCGYSMSIICLFYLVRKKHALFCGESCMKKLCSSLREHTTFVEKGS